MKCPRFCEPAPPPANRARWLWTEESPPLPATAAEGRPWPLISVVTPSFKLGAYHEETLRSILLQGRPELEYVVIDGGSTDDSIAKAQRILSCKLP